MAGIDLILVLVILINLKLLGSSRLGASIRVTGGQGVVLGLLPLASHGHAFSIRIVLLSIGIVIIKGVIFPRLLFRAIREADVSREVQPYLGYVTSLLLGVGSLAISFWLGSHLSFGDDKMASLLVPVALFTIFTGLFLIISRKWAVNQVLGFLIMENGIYLFGLGAMKEASLVVELGILLDVFVAVFVMGIILFHISREFDHMETDRLSALKD
jgi:hydrogenase-4 component E